MIADRLDQQANKVQALAARLGGIEHGQLSIGGIRVGSLAERLGTPFYAYSGEMVVDRVNAVVAAVGASTDLYYSLKANPSYGLCQLLATTGIGAEVASGGELWLALRAGFPPEKVIFAGPGKTDQELKLAIESDIGMVNAESAGELGRLAAIAQSLGCTVRVGLRINPSEPLAGATMRMGGTAQQFGIDADQAIELIERFRSHPSIRLCGLHIYAGTQIFDADQIIAHCRRMLDLAGGLTATLQRPFDAIDLGGGFGVPYFENTTELDLGRFAEGYQDLLDRARSDARFSGTRFGIELGRYLVAPAGIYVTRIVDVKTSRGETFAVTDGGMNHNAMATGNFGQVFRKAMPIALVNRLDQPATDRVNVVGPCCTPLDSFGRQLALPTPSVGDLVGVFFCGAYGYSVSGIGFLSHPGPAEALIWRDRLHLLRPAGSFEQVIDGQLRLETDVLH